MESNMTTQRLPTPGGDDGTWGNILNSFLGIAHNPDGTLQTSAIQQAGGVTSVNSKNPTNGSVTLSASDVGAPTTLAGLSDISGTGSATDSQVLAFQQSSGTWHPATVSSTTVNDASTSTKGILQLTNDLSGTATSPTVVSTHLSSALPINQGGTGSVTQNFVDLSSSQTIAGSKTFSSTITGNISGNAATATTAGSVSTIPALTGDVTSSGSSNTTTLSSSANVQSVVNTIVSSNSTVTSKAPLSNPTFSGKVTTPALQVTTGAGTAGQVLTSDVSGNATWQAAASSGSSTLAGDTDVSITSPANGQVLTYSNTSSQWVNQALPSAPVTSVAGKTGAVSLTETDISNLTTDLAATEKTANKGVASGYAGLNSSGLVPTSQLGTGTASSANYLRGDGSWVTPAGGVALDSTTADIQPLGTAAAGSTGKAADAGHVHPTTGLVTTSTAAGGDLTGTYPSPTLSATTHVHGIIQDTSLPVFNIADPLYATGGAVGAGNATADTTAQDNAVTALKALGYGVLQYPAGDIYLNHFPTFEPNGDSAVMPYAVRGMGKSITTLHSQATSLANSLTVTNPSFDPNNPTSSAPWWGGFTIDGTAATSTAVGIAWNDVSYGAFYDVNISNFSSSDGMYFNNLLGWSEGITLSSVVMFNNANGLHFNVSSGGFPSFDYWNIDSLYFGLKANQNGFVDEASQGTIDNPGQTQHIGAKIRVVANCETSSTTNTGSLFLFKGQSMCQDITWQINGEVDGGNTFAHQGFNFLTSTGAVTGFGAISLPGFANFTPPNGGGDWQIEVNGKVTIPGLGPTNSVSTFTGPMWRQAYNPPVAGTDFPTTFTSGTQWQNNAGADMLITVPITFTGTGTVELIVQTYSISGAGSQIAAGPSGVQIPITFMVYAGSYARIDVTNGTIGNTQALWA